MHVVVPGLLYFEEAVQPEAESHGIRSHRYISIVESNFIGSRETRQALTLILDLHETNEGSEYKAKEFLTVTY